MRQSGRWGRAGGGSFSEGGSGPGVAATHLEGEAEFRGQIRVSGGGGTRLAGLTS